MSNKEMSRRDRHLTRTAGDSDTAFLNSLGQVNYFLLHASIFKELNVSTLGLGDVSEVLTEP